MREPEPIARLINQFRKLPSVGARMAARYAYAVIGMSDEQASEFCHAVTDVKKSIKYCSICGNFTEKEPCAICSSRDNSCILVVESPKDVVALERARGFLGVYHVLFGTLSPLENRGPDDIRIKELVTRIAGGNVKEVILATNPDVEGEATAAYIAKLLKPFAVKTTRIAQGISLGSEIEFADEITLSRAIEDRKEL